jgi:hypothetical protein
VKTLTGTELAARKAQFPQLAAELDREITPWAGNRMLTPDAIGIVKGAGRKAAKKAVAPPAAPPADGLSRQARRLARRLRARAGR